MIVKTELRDVPFGGIVRCKGEWGVVCKFRSMRDNRARVVDFWWDGKRRVPVYEVVEWQDNPKP